MTANSCLSSLGWHHFCPEMGTIHWILDNIFYTYVFSSFCIYLIFVIFWACVHWSYCCQLYFMFCISACDIFWQNLASITCMKCIKIHYLSLWHTLWMHVIVQISWSFMRFLKCCSLPFPAFMRVLMDTHSHGSAKHWLYSSLSIHGYLLISTKRSFFRNLYSYDAIYVGVI